MGSVRVKALPSPDLLSQAAGPELPAAFPGRPQRKNTARFWQTLGVPLCAGTAGLKWYLGRECSWPKPVIARSGNGQRDALCSRFWDRMREERCWRMVLAGLQRQAELPESFGPPWAFTCSFLLWGRRHSESALCCVCAKQRDCCWPLGESFC